jgi:hypothetical protein
MLAPPPNEDITLQQKQQRRGSVFEKQFEQKSRTRFANFLTQGVSTITSFVNPHASLPLLKQALVVNREPEIELRVSLDASKSP